jgi:hypothetical protein
MLCTKKKHADMALKSCSSRYVRLQALGGAAQNRARTMSDRVPSADAQNMVIAARHSNFSRRGEGG